MEGLEIGKDLLVIPNIRVEVMSWLGLARPLLGRAH